MIAFDPERLVQIVAEEIARLLREEGRAARASGPWPVQPAGPCAAAPGTAGSAERLVAARPKGPPGLLFLFTGAANLDGEVWTAVAELAEKSRVSSAFLSRSFLDQMREADVASRLSGVAIHLPPLTERQLLALAEAHAALAIPALSPNTAAKAALGIHDSEPSQLVRLMIQMRKPIVALRELLEPVSGLCPLGILGSAPAAISQASNSHRLALERMGVRFVERGQFVAEGIKALAPRDERPRALPKPKPALKREFITENDLRALKAKGQTICEIRPLTVITDVAREYAVREGIELRHIGS